MRITAHSSPTQYANAGSVWKKALDKIKMDGTYQPSRNGNTTEIVGFRTMTSMRYPVILSSERKLGYKFMAAEAIWILKGRDNLEDLAKYSQLISKFSDDGVTLAGAYGPRYSQQLYYVIKTIAEDLYSRQACMTIWKKNPLPSKDIPCTISLQFIVRRVGKRNCLNLITTMRSQDMWLGWPYDTFSRAMMAARVIIELRNEYGIELDLGFDYLTCGSAHIYESNFTAVEHVLLSYVGHAPLIDLPSIANVSELIHWIRARGFLS